MKQVLADLRNACVVNMEFQAILGPDLKAVTASSDDIDRIADHVNEQTVKLEGFTSDVFNRESINEW